MVIFNISNGNTDQYILISGCLKLFLHYLSFIIDGNLAPVINLLVPVTSLPCIFFLFFFYVYGKD